VPRIAVVTFITPVGRNIKTNQAATTPMSEIRLWLRANWRIGALFYIPDKTSRNRDVSNARAHYEKAAQSPDPGVRDAARKALR